jgi:hypothetical protein
MAQLAGRADDNRERGPGFARPARESLGPGLVGSGMLHVLGILALLLFPFHRGENGPQPTLPPVIPVDIIHLGPETAGPPAPRKVPVSQQATIRAPKHRATSPRRPRAAAPDKTRPADELDAKLARLAKRRLPATDLHIDSDVGESNVTSGGRTGPPAYSLRDFIRAQIERRWSLNVQALGDNVFSVRIRLVMKRDGTVTSATIVDTKRFAADKVYREIARSARNATLLSSPFALPPGDYAPTMAMTVTLNPRDTLR